MQRSNLSMLCLLCALLALPAVGCAQTYKQLAPITEMPALLQLQQKGEAAGEKTSRVPVVSASGARLSIAVHESGSGDKDRVFVLIHGVASDSRAWRFVRGGLTDFDVMAVDMLGCGQSDAPDPKILGDEAYDPTCLASCTLQAMRTRLGARATPAKITFVGHSLGAGSIVRMFSNDTLRTEFGDVLDHVDSVVMISPADVCIADPSAPIKSLLALSDAEVALAQGLGLTKEILAKSALEGVADGKTALKEEVDRMAHILVDAHQRHAVQAMIRAAVPNDGTSIDWTKAEKWQVQYRKMNVPSLILWGSRDSVLPVALGYEMQALIPNARLRVVAAAKHSLMIEQPQACIDLMRTFVLGDMEATPIATCRVQPLERKSAAVAVQ